jgi:hypothetical protein
MMVDMKMTRTSLKIGDAVTGSYHGVAFEGVVSGHDGGGYTDVTLTTPIVVRGSERAELCIATDSDERDSMRVTSRPATVPALRTLSDGAVILA